MVQSANGAACYSRPRTGFAAQMRSRCGASDDILRVHSGAVIEVRFSLANKITIIRAGSEWISMK